MAKSCPRYTIKQIDYPKALSSDWTVYVPGKRNPIGTLMTDSDGTGKTLHVTAIQVDEDHRRCGVGTKLYTAAAKYGCAHGTPLASDTLRSVDSQGFWAKQEQKGRAFCVEKASYSHTRGDAGEVRLGRGNCKRYQLKCPVTDLSKRGTRSR